MTYQFDEELFESRNAYLGFLLIYHAEPQRTTKIRTRPLGLIMGDAKHDATWQRDVKSPMMRAGRCLSIITGIKSLLPARQTQLTAVRPALDWSATRGLWFSYVIRQMQPMPITRVDIHPTPLPSNLIISPSPPLAIQYLTLPNTCVRASQSLRQSEWTLWATLCFHRICPESWETNIHLRTL